VSEDAIERPRRPTVCRLQEASASRPMLVTNDLLFRVDLEESARFEDGHGHFPQDQLL
jgi:hypothetical protein